VVTSIERCLHFMLLSILTVVQIVGYVLQVGVWPTGDVNQQFIKQKDRSAMMHEIDIEIV